MPLTLALLALLALLILAETAVFDVFQQLFETIAQRLLVLSQLVHRLALLSLWPCLPC